MSKGTVYPYTGVQICGVTPDDVRVELRRDENGAGHLTIKVGGNSVALTLSTFADHEFSITDVACDMGEKIARALANMPVVSTIKRECRVCHEMERLNGDNCCKLCE